MAAHGTVNINEHDAAIAAIANEIAEGRLAFFLGAGANMCGRVKDFRPYENLPRGGELAEHLLKQLKLPVKAGYESDLARASEYAMLKSEHISVYGVLHKVFDGDFQITPVHKLVADLPGLCGHHQYIVTTNYDDVMELACASQKEPFDVVWYDATEKDRGFWHLSLPAKSPYPPDPGTLEHIDEYLKKIEDPTRFAKEVNFKLRSVIFKVHGGVWRWPQEDPIQRDSYVITEDDYIDYLAFARQLPSGLVSQLQRRNLLFLGYSLRDWNMRVFLRQVWEDRRLPGRSWAVLDKTDDDLEEEVWKNRGVNFLVMDLEEFTKQLTEQLESNLRARR